MAIKRLLTHAQVGKGKKYTQVSPVLRYPSESSLDQSELDLDDSQRASDLDTDSGSERLRLIGDTVLGIAGQYTSLSRSHSNTQICLGFGASFGPTIARISKDGVLFSREKFFNRSEIVHLGTRRLSVHKPRIPHQRTSIDT
jgi:hypothetical protein